MEFVRPLCNTSSGRNPNKIFTRHPLEIFPFTYFNNMVFSLFHGEFPFSLATSARSTCDSRLTDSMTDFVEYWRWRISARGHYYDARTILFHTPIGFIRINRRCRPAYCVYSLVFGTRWKMNEWKMTRRVPRSLFFLF